MFGSEALDVGIGVSLFFLVISLICSAVCEAIEAGVKGRAAFLERGLREMLADPDGSRIVGALYDHGQISSLFAGRYDEAAPIGEDGTRALTLAGRHRLPSYIPAGQFASALMDLVARGRADPAWPYPAPTASLDPGLTVGRLRDEVVHLPDGRLQRALLAAIDHGGGDLARVKANIERWYDGTMDRVSGWYKRRTQLWLFAIGLLAAAVLNLDAITVTHRLTVDRAVRQSFVAQAGQVAGAGAPSAQVPDIAALKAEIGRIGAPIGWVITAGAVSFGAPFWFDILNKIMVIRSTVKPREKSREEGSEDRASPEPPPPVAPVPVPASTPVPGPQPAPPAPFLPPVPAMPPMPAPDGFEPEQWADGHANPQEVQL